MLAMTMALAAAKGSAIDLKVTGSGTAAVFHFPPHSLPCAVLSSVFHGTV